MYLHMIVNGVMEGVGVNHNIIIVFPSNEPKFSYQTITLGRMGIFMGGFRVQHPSQ